MKEPTVDGIVFFYDYPFDKPGTFDIATGMERLCRAYEKPVVLCMVPDKADWFARKYASSFPWFSEPERAFAALQRSLAHYRKKAGERRERFLSAPLTGRRRTIAPGPSRIASASRGAQPDAGLRRAGRARRRLRQTVRKAWRRPTG